MMAEREARIVVVAILVIVALLGVVTWQLDTCERHITQLECALAQAHAEADTLEAALARLTE